MRVIYISGMGRSGSTLLDRMLGALPGVCTLGEVTDLWRLVEPGSLCACGSPYSGCAFWTAVGERAFGGWDRADLDRFVFLRRVVPRIRHVSWLARQQLTGERLALVNEYVDYFARVYSAAVEVTGARVIIDSSKFPTVGLCLRFARDVDLRVVHLVRDPRGVAYSWTKQVANPGTGAGVLPRFPPTTSALQWNLQNSIAGLLGSARGRGDGEAAHRVPMRRVYYEKLLDDPREGVRDLAGFAGLDLTEEDLSFLSDGYADLPVPHNLGGNPMRFSAGRLPLRQDDTWRVALPPRQRRLVSAICAPLLISYGYSLK
ncbi:sulfotransferase [Micromonospora sp. NBC_01796]|uniref:sulfotransferase n=1 Tax=Micromonospora sp. NBC_01796 TaxID=2975987 RepID=UPI002DD8F47A|nr:sulfotransferase [Micromonospora sp. NBC_01796]WSA84237.1 sulfotransferase [Micromonospora sp. NBC_01796]